MEYIAYNLAYKLSFIKTRHFSLHVASLRVAILTNTLRILALEKLGSVFNHVWFPLEYTPRKFVVRPEISNLMVLETEYNA